MELGAQFHVTGSLTPVRGDSVMVVVYLTDEMEGRSTPVTIKGSQDSAYVVVSQLYRALAESSAGEGERTMAIAGIETESPTALAAFLDGELYLADIVLDSAESAFRRAVDADSTYALAWYRLAQLYEDMDDDEKALGHYGAFVGLWEGADSEYQPLVEDVKGRMARLAVGE